MADLDPYDLDCRPERMRHHQLYLDAWQELGDLLLAEKRSDEALELYDKVLLEDPCCEVAACKLMRLALEDGDRTRALAQYARLEEALERELDVEPSDETRWLRQEAKCEGREVGPDAMLRMG